LIKNFEKFDILLGGGFKKGSNIFFIGKTFTGATRFPLYLISKALENGEGAVIITVDKPYTTIQDILSNYNNNLKNLRFIDLYSIPTQFLDFDYDENNVVLLENRKDLDTLLNVLKRKTSEFERYRIMIPISSLLLFIDPLEMSNFIERVSAMVRKDGSLGFYIMNSGMHEERTVELFKRLSDGVIEFTEREGKHYFRVLGIPTAKTTAWVEFHIFKNEVVIESFTISKIR